MESFAFPLFPGATCHVARLACGFDPFDDDSRVALVNPACVLDRAALYAAAHKAASEGKSIVHALSPSRSHDEAMRRFGFTSGTGSAIVAIFGATRAEAEALIGSRAVEKDLFPATTPERTEAIRALYRVPPSEEACGLSAAVVRRIACCDLIQKII